LHGGKVVTRQTTLSEIPRPIAFPNNRVFRFQPDDFTRRGFEDFDSKLNSKFWDTFDALRLTRIDDKTWSAEIDFRAKDGKKESRAYKGTREEIRKAIEAEKDLPAN